MRFRKLFFWIPVPTFSKERKKMKSHWGRTHGHKDEIIALYKSGQTLEEVADGFGVTRERIRQVLRLWGIDARSGGSSKRAEIRRLAREEAREERCMEQWGQTLTEHASTPDRLRRVYATARSNRHSWGDEWTLLFADWLTAWEGHLHESRKYWLTRIDDNGPWSKENVHVVPAQLVIDKRDAKYGGKVGDIENAKG